MRTTRRPPTRHVIAATLALVFAVGAGGARASATRSGTGSDPVRMNQHFTDAQNAYLKHDLSTSAREIRAAEAIVRDDAKQASGAERDGLVASAGDLKQLSDEVEKGQVQSVDRLKREFARADNRMAHHYQTLAAQSWSQKDTSGTAGALDTAAGYFESAGSWAGEKASDAAHAARNAASELTEGARAVPSEVGDAITALGDDIKKLGERIAPGHATAGAKPAPGAGQP